MSKEVLKDLLKFKWNELLFKLKLVQRYTYDDTSTSEVDFNSLPDMKELLKGLSSVITKEFIIDLGIRVFVENTTHLDYFYKVTKSGEKKMTYTVNNYYDKRYYADCTPRSVYLIEGDTSLKLGSAKCTLLNRRNMVYDFTTFRDFVVETKKYDISRLYKVKFRREFKFYDNEQLRWTLRSIVNEAQHNMEEYYNKISLADLEVKHE